MKLEMTPRDILLIRVSVTALMLVLAVRFLIVPQAEKMREAGEEADVMSFLDDIWNNYPSIQIKTAQMEEETYADADLKAVGQTNLKCVLVVYMCSELEQK